MPDARVIGEVAAQFFRAASQSLAALKLSTSSTSSRARSAARSDIPWLRGRKVFLGRMSRFVIVLSLLLVWSSTSLAMQPATQAAAHHTTLALPDVLFIPL